jgi:hypothetical protein
MISSRVAASPAKAGAVDSRQLSRRTTEKTSLRFMGQLLDLEVLARHAGQSREDCRFLGGMSSPDR